MNPLLPRSTRTDMLFPYTTLFRSCAGRGADRDAGDANFLRPAFARLRTAQYSRTGTLMRICFPYIAQSHQILHSLPIAMEMAIAFPDKIGRAPAELQSLMRI